MKKAFSRLAVASVVAATSLFASTTSLAEEVKTVRVSQIVEHPALDLARQGVEDALAKHGYVQGKNLDFKFATAQGNPAVAVQIAKQYVGEKPDVLVGIATPSAQALASATKTIPMIYSAVTDPVSAKLLKNEAKPEANVTGLSDRSPIDQHVALMQELVPDLKTMGVVYNPGEANSLAIVELLRKYTKDAGIKLVEATALKSADIQSATQAIAADVDVMYAAIDNTVASAIDSMLRVTNMSKTPVFAATDTYVPAGAVASLALSYYELGVQTGDYVAAVLDGAQVAELPAKTAISDQIIVNQKAASKIGFTVPASIVDRATKIIE